MDLNGPDMFKSIYKILTALEKSLDVEEFDIKLIDHEALKISKTRWIAYMEMLIDEGYIKGYQIKHSIYGETMTSGRPMITLKGMEYLQENSIMQRMYNAAQGIVEIIK